MVEKDQPKTKTNRISGVIKKITRNGIIIDITKPKVKGLTGFIHPAEISHKIKTVKKFIENEKCGFAVGQKVHGFRINSAKPERKKGESVLVSLKKPEKAKKLVGIPFKVERDVWLWIEVGHLSYGLVHITCVSEKWVSDPFSTIKLHSPIRVRRMRPPLKNTPINRISSKNTKFFTLFSLKKIKNRQIKSQMEDALCVGDLVSGFVKRADQAQGVYVALSPFRDALVQKSDLCDDFVDDVARAFPIAALVAGRVVPTDGGLTRLSLRRSRVEGCPRGLKDFAKGEAVGAVVTDVRSFGVLARVCESHVVALCHVSKLKNDLNLSPAEILEQYVPKIGQKLQFEIIDIDVENQRMALSNKARAGPDTVCAIKTGFNALDGLKKRKRALEPAENAGEAAEKTRKNKEKIRKTGEKGESSEFSPDNSVFVEEEAERRRRGRVDRLEGRFGNAKNGDDLFAADFGNINDLTKTLQLEAASDPQTAKHWVKLINHFLQQNQAQRAREASARALSEIPLEAERERLKIWAALVALEVDFGTAQSFGAALQNCLSRCEPHFAYQRVIEVLVAKGRFKTANTLFAKLVRLNKRDPAPWVSYARFLFRHSAHLPPGAAFAACDLLAPELVLPPAASAASAAAGHEDPRAAANVDALLRRALRVFSAAQRTDFLLRFARAEFSLGSREKAREVFCGVVEALPTSARAWVAYLSAEMAAAAPPSAKGASEVAAPSLLSAERAGSGNDAEGEAEVRGVFERAVAAGMSLPKAKFVFAKVLEFYRRRGDQAGVEMVKCEARAYGARLRRVN